MASVLIEPLACQIEIMSDGRAVWVRDFTGPIAKFSKNLVEISVGTGRATCEYGPTVLDNWRRWQVDLMKHRNIIVDDQHMPAFLCEQVRKAG
jgi:hypothetical protein